MENDGFGLGAQRRAFDKNDLPQVKAELAEYLHRLRAGETVEPSPSGESEARGAKPQGEGFQPTLGLIVPKEKIAANGDYNLSGERYRVGTASASIFPMVELGEVITLQRGYDLPKQSWLEGPHPIVGSNGVIGHHAEWKESGPGVVTGRSGTIGKVHFIESAYYWPHNTSLFVKDFKGNDPKFVKLLLEAIDLKSLGALTAAVPSLDRKNAHRVKVPLPPLEVQKEIVVEIEGYQKVINGARAVLDHYRPHIPIHPDWPMVELGKLVRDMHQGINTAGLKIEFASQGVPIIQSRNITSGVLDFRNIKFMSLDDWATYREKYKPAINDVLFTNIGTIGKSIVVSKDEDYLIHWNIFIIKTGASLRTYP